MAQMEGLEFQVEGLAGIDASGLKDLISALSALKSSLPTKNKIDGVVSGLQQFNSLGSQGLRNSVGTLARLGEALSALGNSKVSKTVGDNIRNIGDSVRGITDADIQRLREMSDALSGLREVGNVNINMRDGNGNVGAGTASGQAGPTPQDMDGSTDQAQAVTDTISKADSSASGFFGTLQQGFQTAMHGVGQLAGRFVKLGATGVGAGAKIVNFFSKPFATGMGKAVGKVGELFAGLKRIAMYRMMRTAIKMITEGFTTGLKNVYEYSKLVGTQFHNSMDQIATSSLYLKNSLGAMAAPLIQLLAPAIDFVIDKFVSLLNVINMFIARLTGASVATVAKKTFTPWGDSATDAAGKTKKAVKEIRRTLLGFDEINRLDAPTDSNGGGSGGSGGGGADYGSMFEQIPIEKNISDFADRVKQLFKEGKWEELGTFLGQKFNEIVDMVPWGDLGTKVGKGVNGVITTAYYFLKEADFITLGEKFAEFLNNALTEIDTETLGRLLVRKFTVLPEILIGAITKVKWGLVAEKASDFIIGIFDEAAEWIGEINWGELTSTLYDNVIEFIKKIKWSEIASSFAKLLGSALGAVASVGATIVSKLAEGLSKAVSKVKEWGVKYIVKPFKEGFKKDGFIGGVKEAAKSLFKALGDGFKKAVTKIWNVIGKPFADAFGKNFKPAGKVGKKIKEIGSGILDTIGKGIKAIINGDFFKWLKTALFGDKEPDKDKALAQVSVGVGLIQDGWETVKKWFSGLGDKIDLPEPLKAAFQLFKDGWESVKKWFEGLGADIKLPDPIKVGVQLFKDGWKSLTDWLFGGGSGGPSSHSTTARVNVEPTVTEYKESPTVVKPWGAAAVGISQYNENAGLVTPWKNTTATIDDWKQTQNAQKKRPWLSVQTNINDWKQTKNAQDHRPWLKVQANINDWKQTKNAQDKRPWLSVQTNISDWKQTKSGINARPWAGVQATVKDWAQTDSGGKKRPWSGVKALIDSWTQSDKAEKARPWRDALAKITGWEQSDNSKKARPWRDALAKITGWQYKTPIFNGTVKLTKLETTKKYDEAYRKATKPPSNNSGDKNGGARGAIVTGNRFRNIVPQYASGGIPTHGTMFVAGEAGAEVVGHINGRTEVLNASQLASAIHAAVLSAMQQANAGQPPMLNVTVRTENNEVLARAVTRGQRSLDARLNPTAAY